MYSACCFYGLVKDVSEKPHGTPGIFFKPRSKMLQWEGVEGVELPSQWPQHDTFLSSHERESRIEPITGPFSVTFIGCGRFFCSHRGFHHSVTPVVTVGKTGNVAPSWSNSVNRGLNRIPGVQCALPLTHDACPHCHADVSKLVSSFGGLVGLGLLRTLICALFHLSSDCPFQNATSGSKSPRPLQAFFLGSIRRGWKCHICEGGARCAGLPSFVCSSVRMPATVHCSHKWNRAKHLAVLDIVLYAL
jgi:hypothetical protein